MKIKISDDARNTRNGMEVLNFAEKTDTRMETGRNVELGPGIKKRTPGLGMWPR